MLDHEIVVARSQAVWEKHRIPIEFPRAVLASRLGERVSHLAVIDKRWFPLPVEIHNRRIAAEVEVHLTYWLKKIVPTAYCKDLALIAGKARDLNVVIQNEQAYCDHYHSYRKDSEYGSTPSREPQYRRLDHHADTNYLCRARVDSTTYVLGTNEAILAGSFFQPLFESGPEERPRRNDPSVMYLAGAIGYLISGTG
jgi:hypothetical protein